MLRGSGTGTRPRTKRRCPPSSRPSIPLVKGETLADQVHPSPGGRLGRGLSWASCSHTYALRATARKCGYWLAGLVSSARPSPVRKKNVARPVSSAALTASTAARVTSASLIGMESSAARAAFFLTFGDHCERQVEHLRGAFHC